jgi:uncharacterized repeat protein (TIGR01451 family)
MRIRLSVARIARSRGLFLPLLILVGLIIEAGTPSAAPIPGISVTFAKAFNPIQIPLNSSTTLTFTIGNTSIVAGTALAFTDTLPAGLVVATPNGLANTCGGTATAVAGSGSISLTGGTIAAGPTTTCTVVVNVTGTTFGVFTNTSSALSGSLGTTLPVTAQLSVDGPPTINKVFGAASIAPGANTTLTFTLQNNNPNDVLHGVSFTDTFPAGLVVATPNGLSNTCGGTATATAGSSTLSLTGGTVFETGSTCTIAVTVTGTTSGTKVNTSGAVSSTEGGTGGTATATLIVTGAVPLVPPAVLLLLMLLLAGTAILSLRRLPAYARRGR